MPRAAVGFARAGFRRAGSYEDRERKAAAEPLPLMFGELVGKPDLHRFRELTRGLGGSQCVGCFGWVDDPRHVYGRVMVLHG